MYIIVLLILLPLAYFLLTRKPQKEHREDTKASKKGKKREEKTESEVNTPNTKTTENHKDTETKVSNDRDAILNTIKESKEIINYSFSYCGNVVTFHDEKKFCLILNGDYTEKELHVYSKNVESDVISGVAFSKEKMLMVVALKNSKDILFYELKKEGDKLKFHKLDKKIPTTRKSDIKKIVISNDGKSAVTSGTGQDTQIQVFDLIKYTLVKAMDINELENEDMKITPNSDYITVSTAMYEIVTIHLSKVGHHLKNTSEEEVVLKVSLIINSFFR